MGALRAWDFDRVDRAGVDVRARRTGVRALAAFAVLRVDAGFLVDVARLVVLLRLVLARFAVLRLEALVFGLAALRLEAFGLAALRLEAFGLAVLRLDGFALAVLRRAVVPLVVRPLVDRFAVPRPVDFVSARRLVERTDPLLFFRDAAAFNCYPLCWIVAPALEQDAQELPGSAFTAKHSSRAGYGRSNSFYQPDPRLWTGGIDQP